MSAKPVFRKRYFVYVIAVSLIAVQMVLAVGLVHRQKYDGIRINLSGRQRMLSQKLSKEIILYSGGLVQAADVLKTMRVFDITLKGLVYGGDVPVDMGMKSFRYIPPVSDVIEMEKLRGVLERWEQFSLNISRYIEKKDTRAFMYIIDENVRLLAEMDEAVMLMEESYGDRTLLLLVVVLGAVLVIIGLLAFMLYSRVGELRRAREDIRKLERILPICANCKRIRGDNLDPYRMDSWMNLEEFLKKENDINFSHGLCPDCAEKLYPGLLDKK